MNEIDLTINPKQYQAFISDKKIIMFVGGIQSGKTTLGATWMLYKLMQSTKDDNFIITAPTYKTLQQSTLPKFRAFTSGYGNLRKVDAEFKFFTGATVYIRTGTEPESIEGITNVRGIWGDEIGLLSKYYFENMMGRSAFKKAQILGTTTPYARNWLFELHVEWINKKRDDVAFIKCKSTDNPLFPKEEYERQKRILDPRRFKMKYEGEFGEMIGLVYEELNLTLSKPLPNGTKYYGGVDWGYNDPFALVVRAVTPEGIHYRVAEYYKRGLIISEVIEILKARKSLYNIEMFFCDPSQPAHIEAMNREGLNAVKADNNIRKGIDLHYSLIKQKQFFIFEDTNPIGIDEYRMYHYPQEKELGLDKDSKDHLPVDSDNHGIDADRYITVMLVNMVKKEDSVRVPKNPGESPKEQSKRLKWLKSSKNKYGEFGRE